MFYITFLSALVAAVVAFLWQRLPSVLGIKDDTSFSDFSKSIDISFIFFGAAVGVAWALLFWFVASRSKLFYKKYANNLGLWLTILGGAFIGLGIYADD